MTPHWNPRTGRPCTCTDVACVPYTTRTGPPVAGWVVAAVVVALIIGGFVVKGWLG